jgi:hypothetical protein
MLTSRDSASQNHRWHKVLQFLTNCCSISCACPFWPLFEIDLLWRCPAVPCSISFEISNTNHHVFTRLCEQIEERFDYCTFRVACDRKGTFARPRRHLPNLKKSHALALCAQADINLADFKFAKHCTSSRERCASLG